MRDQLYVNACTRYYGDADLVTQCSHRMYLIMRLFMWLIGVFGKGEDSALILLLQCPMLELLTPPPPKRKAIKFFW